MHILANTPDLPDANDRLLPSLPLGAPQIPNFVHRANRSEMGENHLGDFLEFSRIFNNMLWYFWGLYYSKIAN